MKRDLTSSSHAVWFVIRRMFFVFTLTLPVVFTGTGLYAAKSLMLVSHDNGTGPFPEDVLTDGAHGVGVSANGKVFTWYGLTSLYAPTLNFTDVPNGGNVSWSVFTYNTETQELLPANIDENGNAVAGTRPTISADGRYVAFINKNNVRIYLRDMVSGVTTWINPAFGGGDANGQCYRPLVSADGNLVAYASIATNLVASDANGSGADVFIYNRTTGQTTLGMLNSAGQQFNPGWTVDTEYDLSADGRYLFFSTTAAGVHPDTPAAFATVYRRNLSTGTVDLVSRDAAGNVASGTFTAPRSSYDGDAVAMRGQSVGVLGTPMIAGLSHNFFENYAKNLSTGMVWRVTATTDSSLVNSLLYGSFDISGDGSKVIFGHAATNLDPNKDNTNRPDIFLAEYDGDTEATVTWISKGPSGENISGDSLMPVYAKQADVVAFVQDDWEALMGVSETNNYSQLIAYGEFDGGGSSGTTYGDWSAGFDFMGGDSSEAGDPDGDGESNLLEFIFNTDPTSAGERPQAVPMVIDDGGMDYPGVEVIEIENPTGVTVTMEAATDPGFSSLINVVELPVIDLGNGTVEHIFRVESTLDATAAVFFRLTAKAGI